MSEKYPRKPEPFRSRLARFAFWATKPGIHKPAGWDAESLLDAYYGSYFRASLRWAWKGAYSTWRKLVYAVRSTRVAASEEVSCESLD